MNRKIINKRKFVVITVILTVFLCLNVNALKVGDKLGNVLHTDIKVFIDGVQIMGYNIDGWTYIVAEDLCPYGFRVVWNAESRSLAITEDTPTGNVKFIPNNVNRVGSVAFPYVHTDITAKINGRDVTSYNIQGYTVIKIDDLANEFGKILWDNENKELHISIVIPVESIDLSIISEQQSYTLSDIISWNVNILPADATDKNYRISLSNDKAGTLDGDSLTCENFGIFTLTITASNGVNYSKEILIVPTEEQAYNSMISLESRYPEGLPWTNDNYYYTEAFGTGYGCAGFAFILSDEAFGSLPFRKHTDYEKIKVGDLIRINNDSHFIVVLSVENGNITVTEGNYNHSIHWGRVFTIDKIKEIGDYVWTRYP